MKPWNIVGIDPGKTGAFAVLGEQFENYELECVGNLPVVEGRLMADPGDEFLWLEGVAVRSRVRTLCVIEKVHAMPKEGVTSSFNFGKICGALDFWAQQFGDFWYVTPAQWKRELGISSDKREAIDCANKLFGERPEWNRTGPRGGSMISENSGCAEAALIAQWARREIAGVN